MPGDTVQEKEQLELDLKIWELKQQSHMLQKILSDGSIGSVVFIEKRNQIDMELEAAYRRQQVFKEQKLFEQEIGQTEYLNTVLLLVLLCGRGWGSICSPLELPSLTVYRDTTVWRPFSLVYRLIMLSYRSMVFRRRKCQSRFA